MRGVSMNQFPKATKAIFTLSVLSAAMLGAAESYSANSCPLNTVVSLKFINHTKQGLIVQSTTTGMQCWNSGLPIRLTMNPYSNQSAQTADTGSVVNCSYPCSSSGTMPQVRQLKFGIGPSSGSISYNYTILTTYALTVTYRKSMCTYACQFADDFIQYPQNDINHPGAKVKVDPKNVVIDINTPGDLTYANAIINIIPHAEHGLTYNYNLNIHATTPPDDDNWRVSANISDDNKWPMLLKLYGADKQSTTLHIANLSYSQPLSVDQNTPIMTPVMTGKIGDLTATGYPSTPWLYTFVDPQGGKHQVSGTGADPKNPLVVLMPALYVAPYVQFAVQNVLTSDLYIVGGDECPKPDPKTNAMPNAVKLTKQSGNPLYYQPLPMVIQLTTASVGAKSQIKKGMPSTLKGQAASTAGTDYAFCDATGKKLGVFNVQYDNDPAQPQYVTSQKITDSSNTCDLNPNFCYKTTILSGDNSATNPVTMTLPF